MLHLQRSQTNCSNTSSNLIVQQCGVYEEIEDTWNIEMVTPTCNGNELPILQKIKEENNLLRKTIINLNERLGDDTISDSDDDVEHVGGNYKSNINTRHYEFDCLFASKYEFITNVSYHIFIRCNMLLRKMFFTLIFSQSMGDRLYLDGSLKIKMDLIRLLKKMNDNYPSSHQDFDEKFLFHAMQAIFSSGEMKACWELKSFRGIYGKIFLFFKCKYI